MLSTTENCVFFRYEYREAEEVKKKLDALDKKNEEAKEAAEKKKEEQKKEVKKEGKMYSLNEEPSI